MNLNNECSTSIYHTDLELSLEHQRAYILLLVVDWLVKRISITRTQSMMWCVYHPPSLFLPLPNITYLNSVLVHAAHRSMVTTGRNNRIGSRTASTCQRNHGGDDQKNLTWIRKKTYTNKIFGIEVLVYGLNRVCIYLDFESF